MYTVGKFSFKIVVVPLTWPLAHKDIESIDDFPPKEAIKKGRVKNSSYVVKGKRYVPMNVKQAETYRQKGGRMTANGEAFDPEGLNAAHKYLPLPTFVWVTNLENNRRIALRVNDRGPFVKGRIIDLSAGAAKKLGFYNKGTARVLVETIKLKGDVPELIDVLIVIFDIADLQLCPSLHYTDISKVFEVGNIL